MLLGFLLGRLGRIAFAGFVRRRVVDLADVVGLDRKRLVLHAVSRVRLGLDLAFNNDRRPGLESGGELRQRPPNLNLEPIGVLVLGAVLVFPLAVDGNVGTAMLKLHPSPGWTSFRRLYRGCLRGGRCLRHD